jgi:GDP-L-fucose synthase
LQKEGGGRISRSLHSGITDSLPLINVGTGEDLTFRELAEAIANAAGFNGAIEWDRSKPDRKPRKWLDNSRIRAMR